MGDTGPEESRPVFDDLVERAWAAAVDEARTLKVSDDPRLVPCTECRGEVDWWANRCHHCGVAFCEDTRRYRARIYEGLAL